MDISKATEYNDELWCRIYKIFEEAPQFPEGIEMRIFDAVSVIKNYDTEENCYSRNIFMLLFKDSLCGYEDYFVLF